MKVRLTDPRREDGIALVMAVIFMTLLLSVAMTAIYFTTANTSHASLEAASQKAFSAAEAGLNEGISVLANASNPTVPSTLPSSEGTAVTDTTTYPGATIRYWGTYDPGAATWSVYGKGTASGVVTAGQTTSRLVQEQIRVGGGGATVSGTPAWGYIFADNLNGACFSTQESVKIAASLYITGNMCMQQSSQVLASASPVTIGGTLQIADSASMGVSAGHLADFHIGTGCRYGTSGSFTYPCTTTQHVYADHQDRSIPSITKPAVDMPAAYLDARPGPNHACTSGSFPPGFDNDTTRNTSKGSVNIFTASSYDCVFTEGGTTVGEIRWDASGQDLYIKGYIFVDGNIDMAGSQKVDYTGRGSIYANGYVKLWGSQQICAARSGSSCNYTTGAWDPEQKLIAWIAGSYIDLGQSMQIQAAFYAVTDFTQGTSVKAQGPIIANNVTMAASSQVKWLPFNTLADGMPQGSSAYAISVLPGTWQG